MPVPTERYLKDLVLGLELEILPINVEIASLAQSPRFRHGDPADRLIGATALVHRTPLVSKDQKLGKVEGLSLIWD